MKIIILLIASVASVLAKIHIGSDKYADIIISGEEQCKHLLTLKDDHAWYTPLSDRCERVLSLEKYAYISSKQLKLDDYKGHDDKFPVTGSKGKVWVKKPVHMSEEEIEKASEHFNIEESDDVKEIVALQIQCDLNDSKPEEEVKKLNCLKDRYMEKNHFDMKDLPDTFPFIFKGIEVNFLSPPNEDRKDVCKILFRDRHEHKDKNKESDEDDFSDLDRLAEQKTKPVLKPSKIVTKGLNDQVGSELISAALTGNNGNGNNGGIMAGLGNQLLMSMINGALFGNNNAGGLGNESGGLFGWMLLAIIQYFTNALSSLRDDINNSNTNNDPTMAVMGPQHLNTVMKLANNGLKKKEEREIISKSEAKTAVQVVSKTVLHFFILSVRARQHINDKNNKKPKHRFLALLELAMIDALISAVITTGIDAVLPDDEIPVTEAPPTVMNTVFSNILQGMEKANNEGNKKRRKSD